MSARANPDESTNEIRLGQGPLRQEILGRLWILVLVIVFLGALGGSYLVMRGRLDPGARFSPGPTAVVVNAPERSSAVATVVPAISTPASSAVGAQATPSADQAASWYLYQQSHEQDFCSCGNGTSSPTSP